MFDWLTNSTAIIIILPVVVFILTMFFSSFKLKKSQRRIMLAADLSTIFLIIAVHFFMIVLFNRSFLLYILLFLFILGYCNCCYGCKERRRDSIPKNPSWILAPVLLHFCFIVCGALPLWDCL